MMAVRWTDIARRIDDERQAVGECRDAVNDFADARPDEAMISFVRTRFTDPVPPSEEQERARDAMTRILRNSARLPKDVRNSAMRQLLRDARLL